MSIVRNKIVKGWEELSSNKRKKYNSSARAKRDNCAQCGQEENDCSREEINWIGCDDCDRWYHTGCVNIDTAYAEYTRPSTFAHDASNLSLMVCQTYLLIIALNQFLN